MGYDPSFFRDNAMRGNDLKIQDANLFSFYEYVLKAWPRSLHVHFHDVTEIIRCLISLFGSIN